MNQIWIIQFLNGFWADQLNAMIWSLNIIELVIFLNFVRFMKIVRFLRLSEPPCPSWSVTEGRIHRLESVTIQKSLNPRNIRSSDLQNRSIVGDWPFRFLEWNSFPISYFWNLMKVQNWDRLLKFFLEHSSSVCSGIILRIIDHVSGNSRKFQKIPNSSYRFSMKFSKLIYVNIALKSV